MIDFSKILFLIEDVDPDFINYINWQALSEESLPESFIEKYFDNLNLYSVCKNSKLSESFIKKHFKKKYFLGRNLSISKIIQGIY